jgi:diguanylate cyclase (GGDEF)-like protein/PAS domain S-box-containing protein
MHPLLARQIQRYLKDIPETDAVKQFLQAVSDAYHQQDADRHLIENALNLSSTELTTANQELRAIFASIPDKYFRINSLDQVVSYQNADEFGILQEQHHPGQLLEQLFLAPFYHVLLPWVVQCRRSRQAQQGEIPVQQGALKRVFEVRIYPILDNDILLLVADISGRKLLEQQQDHTIARISKQNAVLLSLSQHMESAPDYEQAIRHLCFASAEALAVSKASLWLFTPDQIQLVCEMEYDAQYKRYIKGQLQACSVNSEYFEHFQHQRSLALTDALNAQGHSQSCRAYLEENNILSLIDAPLRVNGQIVGLFRACETRTLHEWTTDEQQFVASLADLISMVLQKRQPADHQQQRDESELRFKSLAQSTDAAIFAFRGRIVFSNRAMEKMSGFSPEAIGVFPLSILMGQPFAEQFSKEKLATTEEGTRKRVEIEFTNRSGEVRWALASVTATQFEGKRTWLATAFDITERKRTEVQLNWQAFHDHLTGLPNRAALVAAIERCLLKASRDRFYKFALLYLDLDHFKALNDSLGHMLGDEWLIEVALRLRSVSDPQQTVARLGGDEFAVLLEDISNSDDALRMAETLLTEIRKPFEREDHKITATASVGIAVAQRHHDSAELLLRQADVAMYQAKENGKNRHALYDALVHAKAQRTLDIEKDLRLRLKRGEFALQYEPIVNLQTLTLNGFDAQIQWHYTREKPTNDYVSLATDSGLITDVEDWAVQKALSELPGLNAPELQLGLRVSARSLGDEQFVKRVNQWLEANKNQYQGFQLCIEEDQLMQLHKNNPDKLAHLEQLACALVIDNMGVGQSCLSLLPRLNLAAIKLHPNLVRDLEQGLGLSVLKSLADMCRALGISLVAKGVANASQVALLQRLRCPLAQGPVFAQAQDLNHAKTLIDKPWQI